MKKSLKISIILLVFSGVGLVILAHLVFSYMVIGTIHKNCIGKTPADFGRGYHFTWTQFPSDDKLKKQTFAFLKKHLR